MEYFEHFSYAIKQAAEEVLPNMARKKKQDWMTDEILELMEARRQTKRCSDEYNVLNKKIRRKCRFEKEAFYQEQCQELEQLEKVNPQKMHDKVRQVTERKNSVATGCIEAKDGTIIMEQKQILHRWQEYIKDLFADNRGKNENVRKKGGNPIMKGEIMKALKNTAVGKATGPDEISIEMVSALEDFGIERLTCLANKIYDEGSFPADMCKSIFITLPKKPGATKCELHRTISLMSQLTKLILRIFLDRLHGRTVGEVAEEQYGFTADKGTRNAIFVLRMMTERAIEMRKDVFVCYIDYAKAFDRVRHEQLFEILEPLDLDGQDLTVIKNLYWDQQAAVRLNGIVTEYIEIQQGVRQGCVLSPRHILSLHRNDHAEHQRSRGNESWSSKPD